MVLCSLLIVRLCSLCVLVRWCCIRFDSWLKIVVGISFVVCDMCEVFVVRYFVSICVWLVCCVMWLKCISSGSVFRFSYCVLVIWMVIVFDSVCWFSICRCSRVLILVLVLLLVFLNVLWFLGVFCISVFVSVSCCVSIECLIVLIEVSVLVRLCMLFWVLDSVCVLKMFIELM